MIDRECFPLGKVASWLLLRWAMEMADEDNAMLFLGLKVSSYTL
ncbi:hypothetical protein [Sutcliffiella horikoshii]|nr:hypothetical protein [Sutcliffiella horikoshii]